MGYETDIDLRNANTSHALLVELVGHDKRVLDIGCAGGELGKTLKRFGCRVAGVEADPAAAQVAEQVLDEVLTGDVTALDLVGRFGKGAFDVVVFGDVLEHLADPVSMLQSVRPLLADEGSVVASIPNVAHGSVRLALLNGRFDYRHRGLLDATHLRFFTRGSVGETFREAGFLPVDMRRTTVGVFDTEIGIRREDFDRGVVDAVEGDPDSTTYQFVLRAVPEESHAGASGSERSTSARRPEPCRIGIWAGIDPDDLGTALVMRVTSNELARRLPGASIRSFSSSTEVRPSPHDGGLPVEALGAWSAERAGELARELDCVVVVGSMPAPVERDVHGGEHPSRFLVEGLGPEAEPECPLVWSAVSLPAASSGNLGSVVARPVYRTVIDVSQGTPPSDSLDDATVAVPDPLVLVPRLLRSEALQRRLEFVRMMGWYPARGASLVVEVTGSLLPHAAAVARALECAVAGSGASVVLVQLHPADAEANGAMAAICRAMDRPAYRVPTEALVDDCIAVIANATAYAASSPSGTALGLAYERAMAFVDFGDPTVSQLASIAGSLGAVVTDPQELADVLDGERFRPTAGLAAKLQSKLDAHFDHVAAVARSAAAARPRPGTGHAALPSSEYVASVEVAHRRMQERLDAERRAVADHLGELRRLHDADLDAVRHEHQTLEADLRGRLDRAVRDLEALQGIRLLRVLRPARAVYARLRGQQL